MLIWHHPRNPAKDWRKKLENEESLQLWELFQRSPAWQSCLRDSNVDTRISFEVFLEERGVDTNKAQKVVDIWLEHNTAPCHPALRQLECWQANGVECAIASNQDGTRKPSIERWLEAHGLGGLPRFISCELNTAKPDPSYFFHIEKALERKPSELMLIDDSKENIDAAYKAGWAVLFIDESYRLKPAKWNRISFLCPLRNRA